MKTWTAHLRRDTEPAVVQDGFSWGALVFGPFWLAGHGAWVPAALSLAAYVLVGSLTAGAISLVLTGCLAWLHGLSGRDLCRWSMHLRGFTETHVMVARNETEALARLLAVRPDLLAQFAGDPA